MNSPRANCRNHGSVAAVGICMQCRNAFCEACLSQIRGINHCIQCSQSVAEARPKAVPVEEGAALGWGIVIGWGLALSGIAWLLLRLALWR